MAKSEGGGILTQKKSRFSEPLILFDSVSGHIESVHYQDRFWPLIVLGSLMFIPGSYHTYFAYKVYSHSAPSKETASKDYIFYQCPDHGILVWIRVLIWILGSVSFLTNWSWCGSGSGSCSFRQWPSRCQREIIFFSQSSFVKLCLHHFSKIKRHRSHKTIEIKKCGSGSGTLFLPFLSWWYLSAWIMEWLNLWYEIIFFYVVSSKFYMSKKILFVLIFIISVLKKYPSLLQAWKPIVPDYSCLAIIAEIWLFYLPYLQYRNQKENQKKSCTNVSCYCIFLMSFRFQAFTGDPDWNFEEFPDF